MTANTDTTAPARLPVVGSKAPSAGHDEGVSCPPGVAAMAVWPSGRLAVWPSGEVLGMIFRHAIKVSC